MCVSRPLVFLVLVMSLGTNVYGQDPFKNAQEKLESVSPKLEHLTADKMIHLDINDKVRALRDIEKLREKAKHILESKNQLRLEGVQKGSLDFKSTSGESTSSPRESVILETSVSTRVATGDKNFVVHNKLGETLSLVLLSDQHVAILNSKNKFLKARPSDKAYAIVADSAVVNADCVFVLAKEGKHVGFKTNFGRYICAIDNGKVNGESTQADGNALFQLLKGK